MDRDELRPGIEAIRRGVVQMLQAVSDTVQETVRRREAVLAELRRAEERLATLEGSRSIVEELGVTRARVEALARDLDELRSQRVELLLTTERSLKAALEMREALLVEIVALQRRRDALSHEVDGACRAAPEPLGEAPAETSVAAPPAGDLAGGRPAPPEFVPGAATALDAEAAAAPQAELTSTGDTAPRPPAGPATPVFLHLTPASRRMPLPRYALTALLALLVVGLAILLTPLPTVFGVELLAVQSGSMEPTIPLGSVVAVRPVAAAELRPGDVITFADQSRPDLLVTHRIVRLETQNGQPVAITKGDANATTDAWNVPVGRVIRRVERSLPLLGYLMVWLALPGVKIALLTIAVLVLVVPSFWPGGKPVAPEPGRVERGGATR